MIRIHPTPEQQGRCHCCGKHLSNSDTTTVTSQYYGQTSTYEAYTACISLPICDSCKTRQKKNRIFVYTILAILSVPILITTFKQFESLYDAWQLVALVFLLGFGRFCVPLLDSAKGYKDASDYSFYPILMKYKWEDGKFEPDKDLPGHPEIEENLDKMFEELEAEGYTIDPDANDEVD